MVAAGMGDWPGRLAVGDTSLGGGRTRGEFDVRIADAPVPARVNGDGDVVRGSDGR